MTKGTKTFRIIISILLAITMICSAFFAVLFILHIEKDVMEEPYGIYVAGVSVTRNHYCKQRCCKLQLRCPCSR